MRCDTKYPIFLVHGTGFRDRKFLNYWGRIPAALEKEGARLYYGQQDSWAGVEANAEVLKRNVIKVLAETGCGKVNYIAHSKGGLEVRYMLSSLGMHPYAASLTTIATPHHGSKTMDIFLKLPKWLFKTAAFFTNAFFRMLGDKNPDFYRATQGFSTEQMKRFNQQNPDRPEVYYQSYAAVMKNPFSDLIMFWPNLVVGLIEGENDGLLPPDAVQWGHFRGVLRGGTNRGISHPDEVDIRRLNFTGKKDKEGIADIRNVYIDMAANLKNMGF